MLIIKIRLACSSPALEDEALKDLIEAQAEIFTEIIEPFIPLEHLNTAYLYAWRLRKNSTFPPIPNELIEGYKYFKDETFKPEIAKCQFCERFEQKIVEKPCYIHNKDELEKYISIKTAQK